MSSSVMAVRNAAKAAFDRLQAGLSGINFEKFRGAILSVIPFGTKSLTARILLMQVIWMLIIYVLVMTAIWFATTLAIENSVRHQGDDWIAKLDEMGMPIYATNKPNQLRQSLAYLKNFPEVAEAEYLDDSGKKIIARYERKDKLSGGFSRLSDEDIRNLKRTDLKEKPLLYESGENSELRVSAPIWIKSIPRDGLIDFSLDRIPRERASTIGFIQVVLDYSKIMEDLNRNLINVSLFIAVMMFGAALVMRYVMHRALQPLSDLEEPLTRLANGETDVRVNTGGDREIARIGVALNTTISALKERDEILRQMAIHDSLTGLVNRAYFIDRLEQELKRIGRGGKSAALFFFDLDRFKNINDTYGHAAGDRLLVQVTRQLSHRIRDNDLFARYGGDEFTLLAYDVDVKQARNIAESFIALMRDFVFYEAGEALRIYFSIGVTIMDNGDIAVQEYLSEADGAVHQAKRNGRNCYSVFERNMSNMPTGTGTGWYARLQDALIQHQTILHYQPLVGLKNQQEKFYEVLLRLRDAEQNLLTPNAFMSAAERFGLMGEFDSQVIDKSSEVLSGLKDSRVVLSLNLSELFMAREDTQKVLQEIASSRHVAPERFVFELSHSCIVLNRDRLQTLLAELAQSGYRFAIDDFGADADSFNLLKDLPVHFLKIEGKLIERLAADSISRISLRSIVEVAAELNLQTVAKNVTDEETLVLVRKLGIDYAQGNFISAPAEQLVDVGFSARRPYIRKKDVAVTV